MILKNMSATVADGGSIADMNETEEEADGAEIRINADFDETPTVKKVEDFRHNGIEVTDPDLLDGTLKIEGGNVQGKWKLINNFPDKVKVWKQDGTNWLEVISGVLSAETNLPVNISLKVEGIDGSVSNKDVQITARFTPTGSSTTCDDSALVTVVKTEFMLTFDDGPFEPQTMTTVDSLANCFVNGQKVKVAFFMVGKDDTGDSPVDAAPKEGIDDPGHDTIAQSVVAAGHDVGNHTDTHKHAWEGTGWLTAVSVADYESEIEACRIQINDALDPDPVKIFRPPYWGRRQTVLGYGPYNPNVGTAAGNKGYQIIWGTSGFGEIDFVWPPEDWEVIADNTITYLKDKWNTKAQPLLKDKPAILCYHEHFDPIPGHISDIVKRIQNKGFLLHQFDPSKCDPDRLYYPER